MARNVIVRGISFRPEELEELDAMAALEHISRSAMVNRLIRKSKKKTATKVGANA